MDYKINYDYISKELCINRDKPMSMCHGKCYLTKQLQKATEQEKKHAADVNKEKSDVLFYPSILSICFLNWGNTCLNKINRVYTPPFNHASFISNIFRPPQIAFI